MDSDKVKSIVEQDIQHTLLVRNVPLISLTNVFSAFGNMTFDSRGCERRASQIGCEMVRADVYVAMASLGAGTGTGTGMITEKFRWAVSRKGWRNVAFESIIVKLYTVVQQL